MQCLVRPRQPQRVAASVRFKSQSNAHLPCSHSPVVSMTAYLRPPGVVANDTNDAKAVARKGVELHDGEAARAVTPHDPDLLLGVEQLGRHRETGTHAKRALVAKKGGGK